MYIGVDLGTTGCKVVLFDGEGLPRKEFNEEYPLICYDGFVEQDANLWLELVCRGVATVSKDCAAQVQGISVSTQGISVVPVDEAGKPLANAITWLDVRAEEENKALICTVGEDEIYRITGKFANPCYTLPKLMWLQKNKPQLYAAAHKFLLPLDFLNFHLAGRALCDYSVAGGIMAYDLAEKCYSKKLLEAAGVEERLLPEVACMGAFVGGLLPAAAEKTGLPVGCPVYLGGQDQKLAALGAGIAEDAVTVSLGTATAVTRLTRSFPEEKNFSRFRFHDTLYSYEGVVDTSGAALKWLKNLLGVDSYEEMNRLAEEAGTAGGVSFDPALTTGAAFTGLTLGTTRGNLVYALLEGVSKNIGQLVQEMGGAKRLYLFGGGSKSPVWCRILAEVTGCEVAALSTPETASLGAAMLASQGKLPPAAAVKFYRKGE